MIYKQQSIFFLIYSIYCNFNFEHSWRYNKLNMQLCSIMDISKTNHLCFWLFYDLGTNLFYRSLKYLCERDGTREWGPGKQALERKPVSFPCSDGSQVVRIINDTCVPESN